MSKRIVFCASLAMAFLLVPGISNARLYKTDTGRFQTMDTFEGDQQDPQSLHKYNYCEGDPVNNSDPSGNDIGEIIGVADIIGPFFAQVSPVASRVQSRAQQVAIGSRLSSAKFWNAYTPVNYKTIPDSDHYKVWVLVGGNVGALHAPGNENTCATRISYALNRSGLSIPYIPDVSEYNSKKNVDKNGKHGDDFRYIIRARDMGTFLKNKWGTADFPQVGTVPALNNIVSGLQAQQVAIFAGQGHSGALKNGYQDPWVTQELPVDVWKLNVP